MCQIFCYHWAGKSLVFLQVPNLSNSSVLAKNINDFMFSDTDI